MLTREQARLLVERPAFQRTVIAVIILNAITLGLETSARMTAELGGLLHVADRAALAVFVVELLLRFYAAGRRFFRDPWSVFDLLVVGISLVPAAGPLAVLRTLRVLRVLRLVSVVPSMRRVVAGLLAAVPGMASVAALLALVIFVAGVMATKLFGPIAPAYFGDLGTTLFTLFQVMTGEAWPDIAREVMARAPLAWIFFVTYILVSSFAVLNLFVAVVVSGMEDQVTSDLAEAEERTAAAQASSDATILAEVRTLRAEVAQLRQERS
ncbi:MAG: ion transporter [Actinophytocola sp.]|uniref:ion transporter n=1 Tax=Actinophytocola sp. TaxID=1872138 RepID=UPI001325CCE7|nr:ion transporter [Actinophytocola sp.]MPZ84980.1 ion transporter [Actinophytocola sp.]